MAARAVVAAAALTAWAVARPAAQFRTGVDLVELYVSVVDAEGRPVTTLGRDDFEVFEDGRPQALSVFTAGRIPLALAVALDRSFSVAGPRLALMKAAVGHLLDGLLPDDQVLLLGVGSRVDVLAPLGTDRAAQMRALAAVDAFGSTSLHDAIVAAIDRIQPAVGRRALVLLSDGVDRYSQMSGAGVIVHAKARDVLVFPVVVGTAAPPLLGELAALTGGRLSVVRDPERLSPMLQTLAAELRAQYLIGYVPSRSDGAREWRSVRVSVRRAGLMARSRQGYWTH